MSKENFSCAHESAKGRFRLKKEVVFYGSCCKKTKKHPYISKVKEVCGNRSIVVLLFPGNFQ